MPLPDQVVRWEWKRFPPDVRLRAAQDICACRQKLIIPVSAAHR